MALRVIGTVGDEEEEIPERQQVAPSRLRVIGEVAEEPLETSRPSKLRAIGTVDESDISPPEEPTPSRKESTVSIGDMMGIVAGGGIPWTPEMSDEIVKEKGQVFVDGMSHGNANLFLYYQSKGKYGLKPSKTQYDSIEDGGIYLLGNMAGGDIVTIGAGGAIGGGAPGALGLTMGMKALYETLIAYDEINDYDEFKDTVAQKGASILRDASKDNELELMGRMTGGLILPVDQKVADLISTTMKETAKGEVLGYTLKPTEMIKSKVVKTVAEMGIFGTVGPILEGESPSLKSYGDAAFQIGMLKAGESMVSGASRTIGKMRKGAQLGEQPESVKQLQYQMEKVGLTKQQAEANGMLVRGAANYYGMNVDEYVRRNFAGFTTGGKPLETDFLKQYRGNAVKDLERIKAGKRKKDTGEIDNSAKEKNKREWAEYFLEHPAGTDTMREMELAMEYWRKIKGLKTGQSALRLNDKTVFSIDISSSCPYGEIGHSCIMCYVDLPRAWLIQTIKDAGQKYPEAFGGEFMDQAVDPDGIVSVRRTSTGEWENIGTMYEAKKIVTDLAKKDSSIKNMPRSPNAFFNNAPFDESYIKDMPDLWVNFLNEQIGGLRIFSTGDFKKMDIPTLDRIVESAKERGLKVKFITKQEECVDRYAKYDNVTFNLSSQFNKDMLPTHKRAAYDKLTRILKYEPKDAEAAIKKGTVMLGKGFFSQGFSLEKIKELQDKYGFDKVKGRYVSMNQDEYIRAVATKGYSVVTRFHGFTEPNLFKSIWRASNRYKSYYEPNGILQDPKVEDFVASIFENVKDPHLKEITQADLDHVLGKGKTTVDEFSKWVDAKTCCVGGTCGGCLIRCATGAKEQMGLFKKWEDGTPLAGVEFLANGKALIKVFNGPANVATVSHELAHVFRRVLDLGDLKIAGDWAGAIDGVWTREAEENFANGHEKWLSEGVAPSPQLARIFELYRNWMKEIYGQAEMSGKKLSPEMKDVFNRLTDKPKKKPSMATPKKDEQGNELVPAAGSPIKELPGWTYHEDSAANIAKIAKSRGEPLRGTDAFADVRDKRIYVANDVPDNVKTSLYEHEKAHVEFYNDDSAYAIGESILNSVRRSLDKSDNEIEAIGEVLPETVTHMEKYLDLPDYNEASLIDEAYATEIANQQMRRLKMQKPKVDVTPSEELNTIVDSVKRRGMISPEEKKALFNIVANTQRGRPEQAMLKIHSTETGLFGDTAEHIGDISHRISQQIFDFNGSFAIPKIERMLNRLKEKYGFEREVLEQINQNREYRKSEKGIDESFEERLAKLKSVAKEYAEEHKKIPVFNRAQYLAREAAVSLGEWRFDDAIKALEQLKAEKDKGSDSWNSFVHEFDLQLFADDKYNPEGGLEQSATPEIRRPSEDLKMSNIPTKEWKDIDTRPLLDTGKIDWKKHKENYPFAEIPPKVTSKESLAKAQEIDIRKAVEKDAKKRGLSMDEINAITSERSLDMVLDSLIKDIDKTGTNEVSAATKQHLDAILNIPGNIGRQLALLNLNKEKRRLARKIATLVKSGGIPEEKKQGIIDISLKIKSGEATTDEIRAAGNEISSPEFWRYAFALWVNNILWGPSTHFVNTVSNATQYLIHMPHKAIRGAVDLGLSAISGSERKFYVDEALPTWAGLWKGIRGGAGAFKEVMSEGVSKTYSSKFEDKRGVYRGVWQGQQITPENWAIFSKKIFGKSLRVPEALKGKKYNLLNADFLNIARRMVGREVVPPEKKSFKLSIGQLVELPTQALVAEDVIFKSLIYESEKSTIARRLVRNAVKRGEVDLTKVEELYDSLIANPTKEMRSEAFKKSNGFGLLGETTGDMYEEMGWKLQNEAVKVAQKLTFTDEPGEITRSVNHIIDLMPWGTGRYIVPFTNIATQLLKRGLEYLPGYGAVAMRRAGEATAEILAKQIEGLIFATTMWTMADMGMITGKPPESRAERDALYATGWKPYSIKIGGTYYQWNRIEPFKIPAAMIMAIHDQLMKDADEKVLTERLMLAAKQFGEAFMDSHYLKGLQDLLGRYGAWESWVQRFAASWVPGSAMWRFVNRGLEGFEKGEASVKQSRTFKDAFSQTIPGGYKWSRPQLNALGEEQYIEGGAIRQMLPFKYGSQKDHLVYETLLETEYFPGRVQRTVQYRGKKYELTEDEVLNYQRMAGRNIYDRLSQIIERPGFDRLTKEQQKKLLHRVTMKAKSKARANFVKDFLYDRAMEELKR